MTKKAWNLNSCLTTKNTRSNFQRQEKKGYEIQSFYAMRKINKVKRTHKRNVRLKINKTLSKGFQVQKYEMSLKPRKKRMKTHKREDGNTSTQIRIKK